MKFEWDPKKEKLNLRKHGVEFSEAKTVFEDDEAITIYDENHSVLEERFKIIGLSRMARELTVCHCVNDDNTVTRIISARRASKSEVKLYERRLLP